MRCKLNLTICKYTYPVALLPAMFEYKVAQKRICNYLLMKKKEHELNWQICHAKVRICCWFVGPTPTKPFVYILGRPIQYGYGTGYTYGIQVKWHVSLLNLVIMDDCYWQWWMNSMSTHQFYWVRTWASVILIYHMLHIIDVFFMNGKRFRTNGYLQNKILNKWQLVFGLEGSYITWDFIKWACEISLLKYMLVILF